MISIVVISKDEPALEYTLKALTGIARTRDDVEVLVIDASEGRVNYLRNEAEVAWIDYKAPPGVRVSIPHQRNLGVAKARGGIIVFTDAGCEPSSGWLDALTTRILTGQDQIVTGVAISRHGEGVYDDDQFAHASQYVNECSTINLAFHRSVFETICGFDETFRYGSDVDFSWRAIQAGYKIFRNVDAVVTHDWGSRSRQARRAYAYGRARVHLYKKHRSRLRSVLRNDPIAVAYPIFLLALPLTVRFRLYPAVLLLPIAKNRGKRPFRVVMDHLIYGVGVLRGLADS